MEEDIVMARPSTSASPETVEDLNHIYDDRNVDVHQLNCKNEEKPRVYDQQKSLARHILNRIKLSLKLQNKDCKLSDFKSIDIQVSLFLSN